MAKSAPTPPAQRAAATRPHPASAMKNPASAAQYPSEHAEQCAVFDWVATRKKHWPELECLYHINNGPRIGLAQARRAKAAGVVAGVPDLHLPVARRDAATGAVYYSCYIELKTIIGRLSTAQAAMHVRLARWGNLVVVAKGADQAIAALTRYLQLPALEVGR